jgi:hypothetical protein
MFLHLAPYTFTMSGMKQVPRQELTGFDKANILPARYNLLKTDVTMAKMLHIAIPCNPRFSLRDGFAKNSCDLIIASAF